MLLIINTIDPNQEERYFSSTFEQLEAVFEFLNHVVREGDTLISAKLIENGKLVNLPIEVFDGIRLSIPLKELELEWISVLAKPTTESSRWYTRRLDYCEQQIIDLELMISTISTCGGQAEYSLITRNKGAIAYYQSTVKRYKSQLSKARLLRGLLLDCLELI